MTITQNLWVDTIKLIINSISQKNIKTIKIKKFDPYTKIVAYIKIK
jgi:hypothetical protein